MDLGRVDLYAPIHNTHPSWPRCGIVTRAVGEFLRTTSNGNFQADGRVPRGYPGIPSYSRFWSFLQLCIENQCSFREGMFQRVSRSVDNVLAQ